MKRLSLLIALVALVSLLAACAPAPTPVQVEKEVTRIVERTVKETVVVAGTPQVVEKVVTVVVEKAVMPTPKPQKPVVVLQGAEVISMDPMYTQSLPDDSIQKHVFQTLTRFNEKVELEPYVAESWKNVDPLTWEFKIKPGYKFHNGEPVNAEAFAFTLNRGNQLLAAGEGDVTYQYTMMNMDRAEAVDEYTLRVITKSPNPIIPVHMAHTQTAVLPPKYLSEHTQEEFEAAPIGSGPYKVVEVTPGERVVLEAWDEYPDGPPSIKTIIWRAAPEAATRINELKAGQADIIVNVPPDLALDVDKAPGVHMALVTGMRRIFFGLGAERHPALKDTRVRQAMNYAFDCETMMKSLLSGAGTCSGHIINAPNGSPNVTAYPYDPDKAAQLLDEAGWVMGPDGIRVKDGQKLSLEMDCPNGRYIKDKEMCLILASDLKKVGIEVKVNVLDWSVFIGKAKNRGEGFADMHLIGSGPGFECRADLGYVEGESGSNRSRYNNPELNAILKELDNVYDPQERLKLCWKAEEIAFEDAAVIQVYMQTDFYGVSDRLLWEPRPDERILLIDAKLVE
ncbi:MAG: ABC transporter substrate-binding protein [Anaerolineae bacterium]